MDLLKARDCLADFNFAGLFTIELGWSQPERTEPVRIVISDTPVSHQKIALLGDVAVFEVVSEKGNIPGDSVRAAVHKEISLLYRDNLIIFIDDRRSQSLWYWVKRQDGKSFARDHFYFRGQPGDLFLSKLNSMVFEVGEFDKITDAPVVEVTKRLKNALDVERVTRKFYKEFQELHLEFLDLVDGIDDDRDRRWYTSVMLNRLMFIYFLQRKFFIDNGDDRYLQNKLAQMKEKGKNLYYEKFLRLLFFEGFARPEENRSQGAKELLGKIKYLNGGLFLLHPIEIKNPGITIKDEAFENLFSLFERYSWNLNDTPGGEDNEINPDVLGYIFEKYINQKAFGAYYTRPEITEYLCERTIYNLVLDRVNHQEIPGVLTGRHFDDVAELLINLDAGLCWELIDRVLPGIRILDPSCGSAAFLVSAMKTLINIYAAVIGKIKFLTDKRLESWLKAIEKKHTRIDYYIKKTIITENLFGVDIMEEAVEIGKLRLFLALVAAVDSVDDLEPLPNIDFNILTGNSLVGLMHVDDKKFEGHLQGNLFRKSYRQVVDEKNRLVTLYRKASAYSENLQSLREDIDGRRDEAIATLNSILCDDFKYLDIKFEQGVWDDKKKKPGKPVKRNITQEDIDKLKPFHWGFEFNEIINSHAGFDVIITNPPWEIFKPNAKEFFEEHSRLVTKKKMTIKDFEKEQAKLLKDPEIRGAWLEYLGGYPYMSAFFRSSPQYKNQISIVKGKKAGTDINLYKLFTEQCFNLLREGGYCGIVIPSGIYTDLGTKQLREMLFTQTRVTGLFGFENRKGIFEGVHRSFKFAVLTYEKGGITGEFPAAFMRLEASELDRFPKQGAIVTSIDMIHRLSPDSLSILEFKELFDVNITTKAMKFNLLGEIIDGQWNLKFTREFDMTLDSHLFKVVSNKDTMPLYEGKMIHQFIHDLDKPRYWVYEREARKAVLGRTEDKGQRLDYQDYRLGFRKIARNTDERTLISTIIPPNFLSENFQAVRLYDEEGNRSLPYNILFYICAVWNSFIVDYLLRMRVSANINFFYIYQLPVPRLTGNDTAFWPIVKRSARLICTTPEFDALAREAGLTGYQEGAADPGQRAQLRAELDGLIAHLYGLTEDEFAYILTTFPLVEDSVKTAALNAFHKFGPNIANREIAALIQAGESKTIEFKSTARWDIKEKRINKTLEHIIIKTVAAFLNTAGGSLLIGVDDEGKILGLANDYKTLGKKQDKDGFENWLTTLLLDNIGKDFSPFIHIDFYIIDGKEICKIAIKEAPGPAYVKEGTAETLFIRTGNSTRSLTTREAVEYCKQKWDPGLKAKTE